ncbi:MAG: hypothetical protein ISN28_15130 [Ectothiorhodospiraceae bacterium AqS1]|nr:hypothetical protein [Ectothiorhodospiraceae bacterium AqS1]
MEWEQLAKRLTSGNFLAMCAVAAAIFFSSDPITEERIAGIEKEVIVLSTRIDGLESAVGRIESKLDSFIATQAATKSEQ